MSRTTDGSSPLIGRQGPWTGTASRNPGTLQLPFAEVQTLTFPRWRRCMKGIREEDVRKLGDTDGFDRVLTDMVGAAVVIESRFGKLIDKHY